MFAFNTSVLLSIFLLYSQTAAQLQMGRWVLPVRDMSVHIEKDVKENSSVFKSQYTKEPPV